ncbi:MAG: type II toxin-antitoxin system RelE/ParE family toxin [Candidatus Omnitrophica bacterium]|jgi:addiction module RelE/StbE family toxin|nr:type II toxin-antitoxin system RelE/ParE family toxin [Candidatus Omnitrophota bacterium]
MKYDLLYHPEVKEDIRKIPANIKARIRKAIEARLQNDPIQYGQPLRQSLKGHRKLRVGDWRVIYHVEATTVVIIMIGNRKDVYKEVYRRV